MVLALWDTVGWNLNDIEAINLLELLGLSKCRTGHAGKLVVKAEVVLERNGGERLGLLTHGDMLLGLNCLVETFAITAALHQAAGEFIHDDDFAVRGYHVILVALKESARLESLVEVVNAADVLWREEVLQAEELLYLLNTLVGQSD